MFLHPLHCVPQPRCGDPLGCWGSCWWCFCSSRWTCCANAGWPWSLRFLFRSRSTSLLPHSTHLYAFMGKVCFLAPESLSEEVLVYLLSAEGASGEESIITFYQGYKGSVVATADCIQLAKWSEALLLPTCSQIFSLSVLGCFVLFPEHKPFSKQIWWFWGHWGSEEGTRTLLAGCTDIAILNQESLSKLGCALLAKLVRGQITSGQPDRCLLACMLPHEL